MLPVEQVPTQLLKEMERLALGFLIKAEQCNLSTHLNLMMLLMLVKILSSVCLLSKHISRFFLESTPC